MIFEPFVLNEIIAQILRRIVRRQIADMKRLPAVVVDFQTER